MSIINGNMSIAKASQMMQVIRGITIANVVVEKRPRLLMIFCNLKKRYTLIVVRLLLSQLD